MENLYLAAVVREMSDEILGRAVARISLAGSALLLDLRLPRDRVLRVSLDRASPAFYLSEVDRERFNSGARANDAFISLLRKHLIGAKLTSLTKDAVDRIVLINFESFDAGGDTRRNLLVLSLTGRSANAWLLDSEGAVIGSFNETAPDAPPIRAEESTSLATFVQELDQSASHEQIVERFFGRTSSFGPLLKREFEARSHHQNALDALKSLIADLNESDSVPQVYSRIPLEQIGKRVVNLKEDLVLTHVDLTHAGAMFRRRFPSLSEAADHYYQARGRAKQLLDEYNSLKQLLAREIKKRESAMRAVESDQVRFENPDKLKRLGDLILANLATAHVEGSRVTVVDYYDELQPTIEIQLLENKTLQQTAVDYFSRYQKARRALTAIAARRQEVAKNLDPLRELASALEQNQTSGQITETRNKLDRLLGRDSSKKTTQKSRSKVKLGKPGRRFVSSDGFEVLVGRNDRDNEVLTFRTARSLDVWMHAADYPGSHVLISNPSRNPVPQRTITEAAELAAFYSQAKREGKAAVHYTQRKFVSKPPRAKPGLVRLSSFKTILVVPRCAMKRIE